MFRESPLAIPLSFERTKYPAIQDRMKSLIQNWEEALAAHEVARSWISERQRSAFTLFKKGDKVWLDSKTWKQSITRRWSQNESDPSPSLKSWGPITYKLQLLKTWQIHNVFHATLLCPYKENSVHGENFAEPPPELVEGEEVYEIKTILNHRKWGWGY